MKRFVILCHARTGSTWLASTLNNIEQVTCGAELFFYRPHRGARIDEVGQRFWEWRKTRPGIRPFLTYAYLDQFYESGAAIATGFKLTYSQLRRSPEVGAYILSQKIAVIHLVRNFLEIILSGIVARQRKQFHFKQGEQIPEEQPLVLEPAKLVKDIRHIETSSRWLSRLLKWGRVEHLQVHYEDLAASPENFRPIWDFVGVDFDKNPPTWESQKARRKTPQQLIENYSAVEAALTRAGYGHLLEGETR